MNRFMWTENEVPIGRRVHIYMPGSEVPERHNGRPIVLEALAGGVPLRKKLYVIEDDRLVTALEGFRDGIRFSSIDGVDYAICSGDCTGLS